jgi:hypothetical protein
MVTGCLIPWPTGFSLLLGKTTHKIDFIRALVMFFIWEGERRRRRQPHPKLPAKRLNDGYQIVMENSDDDGTLLRYRTHTLSHLF